MQRLIIAPGQRFNKLVVVADHGTNKFGKTLWLCKCDCGKETIAIGSPLVTGRLQSCGCVNREIHRKRLLKHGMTNKGGICKAAPEYSVWQNMRRRCEDPTNRHYEDYGGRGISVCERWHDFQHFLSDLQSTIGLKPKNPEGISGRHWSLDRISNSGNYEPGNVRWATGTQQASNRRPRRWHKRPPKS